MHRSLLAHWEEITAGKAKLWNYACIDSKQICSCGFKYTFPVSFITFLNISQDKN